MQEQVDNEGNKELAPSTHQPIAERGTTAVGNRLARPEIDMWDEDEEGINLLELWRVLVKRKWTIITFFSIVVVAVITATFLQTPVYRSTLTMQIEREAPKVLDFQTGGEGSSAGAWEFYQTQYELLKSRSLAERVVERLNLVVSPNKEDSLRGRFKAMLGEDESASATPVAAAPRLMPPGALLAGLTVEPVRDSRLVRLHYDSSDPDLTARILNAWAEVFIGLNLERRLEASSYAREFLQEQLRQVKAKLEDSERELVDFARKEQIVNVDDEMINHHSLQEVATALAQAEQDRITAEVLYRQMQRAGGQGLTRVLESELIAQLKQTKAALEAAYQENLKVYKPGYPKMVSLASQIDEVQASIDTEVQNIRFAVQADYDAARQQELALREKLEALKTDVMDVQDRSIQYNILKREVDTNRQLYDGLLQEFKEVGVAGGVGTNNVSVVDKAMVPRFPFKPNLLKNAVLAVFLGLLGGIGLAFLFEHLDDSLKMPYDVERHLTIPVLGLVPHERQGRRREGDDAPIALLSQHDPRSGFAEAYRSVRTALQFATSEGVPKVLTVTSAAPGEGKTTTALSLAIQFAQAGRRVLLVDADLRNPSLHRNLTLDNSLGLTNYLTGEATPSEVSKPTTIANLFVIPSGHLPPNPAELIAGAKMVSLVSLAMEKFDQVILDCPPVLGLADALILGNLSSGTILVVESGGTRRGNAQGALKRLRTANTHVVGGVLTKLKADSGSYGYYQSYYYYYGDNSSSRKRLAA